MKLLFTLFHWQRTEKSALVFTFTTAAINTHWAPLLSVGKVPDNLSASVEPAEGTLNSKAPIPL